MRLGSRDESSQLAYCPVSRSAAPRHPAMPARPPVQYARSWQPARLSQIHSHVPGEDRAGLADKCATNGVIRKYSNSRGEGGLSQSFGLAAHSTYSSAAP